MMAISFQRCLTIDSTPPRRIVVAAALAIVAMSHGLVHAGGAGVPERLARYGRCDDGAQCGLGICPDGKRCAPAECTNFDSCQIDFDTKCADQSTCRYRPIEAFRGQLAITVLDDPPVLNAETSECGASNSSSLNVALRGEKRDGSTFTVSASYSWPQTCQVACGGGGVGYRDPYFCSTSATRLSELAMPTAGWLQDTIFPADLQGSILAQFPGVQGQAIVVRVNQTDFDDHSGSDLAASTRRFCVKVYIVPTS